MKSGNYEEIDSTNEEMNRLLLMKTWQKAASSGRITSMQAGGMQETAGRVKGE